jgi:hypothetical protein
MRFLPSLRVRVDLGIKIFGGEAIEPGFLKGGIHALQTVRDYVHAVVQGDEVVLLHVGQQLLIGGGGLVAEFERAGLQIFDGVLVFTSDGVQQVGHELGDVAVGDERGGVGIAMGGRDVDEEAVADGLNGDAADEGADARGLLAGLEFGEVGLLKELDLVRGEGGHHLVAKGGGAHDLKVGVELDVAVDGRIDDLLAGDDGLRLLDAHRGRALIHRDRAGFVISEADGDEKGEGKGDPDALPENDVIIAQRAALDHIFIQRGIGPARGGGSGRDVGVGHRI